MRHHPTTPVARVLVAGDDAQTRRGIRLALDRAGFEVCGEAGDAASAIELALRLRPEVCLLDVDLPGGGISAARAIATRAPTVRVLVLAWSHDEDALIRALEAGVSGYLLKRVTPAALAAALNAVLTDAVLIPPAVAGRLVGELRERRNARTGGSLRRDSKSLTSREWEVAELLRDGLSTSQIADRLYISETTVRRHVSSILRKLDVPDRAAAIRAVGSA